MRAVPPQAAQLPEVAAAAVPQSRTHFPAWSQSRRSPWENGGVPHKNARKRMTRMHTPGGGAKGTLTVPNWFSLDAQAYAMLPGQGGGGRLSLRP
mmetsp:Transcript_52363/g.132344  ORF Transcript_52363/g.132344 Transcript_52363/m.132344 type:complete len:95 (+) Transcript_52363:675-959(+)